MSPLWMSFKRNRRHELKACRRSDGGSVTSRQAPRDEIGKSVNAKEQRIFEQSHRKGGETKRFRKQDDQPGVKRRLRTVPPVPLLRQQHLLGLVHPKRLGYQAPADSLQQEITAQ